MTDADKRNDFAPFLFGNMDEDGELEVDFLDEESKKSLSSLGKLGLDSVISEIVDEEDFKDSSIGQQTSQMPDIKSPFAVDYSEINELADDEDDVDSVVTASTSCEERTTEKRKLNTPLASILPKKYANVDVRELFPDFNPDNVLRFSRLFGNTGKNYSTSRWKALKKRIKRRRLQERLDPPTSLSNYKTGWSFNLGTPPTSPSHMQPDDEQLFLKPSEEEKSEKFKETVETVEDDIKPSDWRFGPARYWYDLYNVPVDGQGFDYGFKLADKSTRSKSPDIDKIYPPETFLMISQIELEDYVLIDGNKVKQEVLEDLYAKPTQAGFLPSSSNRVFPSLNGPSRGTHCSTSMLTVNSTNKLYAKPSNFPTLSAVPSLQSSSKQIDENGEDIFYSILPIENDELIYGNFEEDIIWNAKAMPKIPKPKILTYNLNDDNFLLEMPEDIDPTKQKQDSIMPVKVKIPQPHVKKSKMLLGKAGVINMLEEDVPLSPNAKSSDYDPFNISDDKYYMSHISETSLKVGVGSLIQHSTPVIELRAPFVQTHMGPMRLRHFHRPPIKRYSWGALASIDRHFVTPLMKYIKKKSKLREHERLASGGGDVFFMRTPEDLTGRDGDLVLIEFCEEHPPLMNLVGMCSKIKNYYKRRTGKDQGPPSYRYGETAYAHTAPFLGSLAPGKSLQALENNMYRAPIFEHDIPQTDFLVIRTRNQYFIREFNGLYVAGQMCPLYEVPSPNSKRANNFVRDFLQVFIYRLFWKSKGSPKRICMDDVRKAFPSHSESSIRKRLKLCADFKRTGNESNLWVIKKDFRLPPEEEIREMVSPEQCCAYFSMIAAEQRLKDAGYGEKFMFPTQEDDEDDVQLKIDDEIKVAPWNTTRAYIQAMKGKCLLQLTGPADPTGCGEGFSYIRVPNKPITKQNKEEQKLQPKRIVTGTDADLRRLSLNNAKALLRKFGVPEEEIKKLSRWEVIDVVRTLSTEKAKAGEEGMTKFSRGNRFSIAEHQERYKEECQRIFDLQNKMLSSNEYLSTSEDDSTDEENISSDIEEMGKNIESMLANNTTSMQLSLEREEHERHELRKLILDSSKKQVNKKKDENVTGRLATHDIPKERVLKIYRTFHDPDGKSYTRLEIVRNAAVIDAYVKIRTTKDEEFIKQFAILDDAQKEEMKREKRRIQEQLRRIKRNQEKERITTEMRSRLGHNLSAVKSSQYGTSSNGNKIFSKFERYSQHHHSKQSDNITNFSSMSSLASSSVPLRRRPKIKPDLKVKCGACGATGHMRTNKACPQYQQNAPPPPVVVALTQEEEQEIDKKLDDEENLVNIEGTKLKLSSKLIRHAEDVKRRSLLLKVPKDALIRKRKPMVEDTHCDYLKKNKSTNRRCIDAVVALSTILESILNEMRNESNVQPFLFPVNSKDVPDYYKIVSRPMDLQTMREKLREKKYQTREEFLADVNQIVENSTLYNGAKSFLTLAAKQMLQLCVQRLAENEDKLMHLEKTINPLLDDNDQVALSYILSNILNKIKSMSESWPFSKPVNKRVVKDYYEIVKQPMDLETITNNIQGHKYHSRYEFLSDIKLIFSNCIVYNGVDSTYSQKAETILKATQSSLEEYDEHLSVLEQKLKMLKSRLEQQESGADSLFDDQTPDSQSAIVQDEDEEQYAEFEFESEKLIDYSKSDTQNLLEDDLHCSSEDDDMMKEVKGIEVQVANTSVHDYESQQVAEAMMQLGNFDYCAVSGNNNASENRHRWQGEDKEADRNVEEEQEVQMNEIEEHLDVKAFQTSHVYGNYEDNDDYEMESSSNNTDLKTIHGDLDISDSDEDMLDEFGSKLKHKKQQSPSRIDDDNTDNNDGFWF